MRGMCPISGKNLPVGPEGGQGGGVPDPALVAHVVETTALSPGEAERLIGDVIAFHAHGVEEYVRRRHAELRTYGARNPTIFARIAEELPARVFAAPELTERQLRRMVYG